MSPLSLLQTLECFVRALASYYTWLRVSTGADDHLCETLDKLAAEEWAKVTLIRLEKRLFEKDPSLFHTLAIDLHELKGIAASLALTMGGHPNPPAGEALFQAIRAEAVAASLPCHQEVASSNGLLEDLLRNVGLVAATHERLLCDIARAKRIPVNNRPRSPFFIAQKIFAPAPSRGLRGGALEQA